MSIIVEEWKIRPGFDFSLNKLKEKDEKKVGQKKSKMSRKRWREA